METNTYFDNISEFEFLLQKLYSAPFNVNSSRILHEQGEGKYS